MRKNKYRVRHSHKYIKIVLMFVLTVLLTTSFEFTTEAQEDATVIKVGYMLNYGTIKSPIVKESEGYGYEYLTTIFEYIDEDYELEFVYCEWEEAKEMLLSGEIDILGPTTYTESNADILLFTEESFGDNFIFLSTLSENSVYTDDYDDINGSIIAVQEDNPNEYLLYEFLDEHNLQADIVYFTDNDYERVLEDNGYDFVLASSLQTFDNLIPVAILGNLEFYYVTSLDNSELISSINDAMQEIEYNEFMYQEKLYLEYYDYTILSSSYVTEEEYAILQEQEIYNVGVQNLYCPICYLGSNNEFQGIAIDVLEMMAEIAGISYNLVEITEETTEAEWDALDFAFTTIGEDSREDAIESDAYYAIPFLMIERDDVDEIDSIGIMTYYGITEVEYEDHLYGRTIYEFSNVMELMESYNSGEIDSMIMTTTTLNMERDEFDNLNFVSNTMDINLNLTIAYSEDYSSDSIEIFNKIIAQLDTAEIESSVLLHSSSESTYVTIIDFLKENPMVVIGTAIIIVLYVLITEYRRRKALYNLLNYDELTLLCSKHRFVSRTNKILKKKFRRKNYSIVTIDIDNFKYINEFYGYNVGTVVLKKVAREIKENAQNAVLISRVNADNFMLLVKREGIEEKLFKSIDGDNPLFKSLHKNIDETYRLTFSIGIYDIDDPTLDLNFMIDCANSARGLGKNVANTTINKFTAEMDSKRIIDNDIVANMVKAIADEEFVLYYQPKICFETSEIMGAEALVRWMKNGNLVPPNQFIPVFEKNGFIENLDYYVLAKACEFIKKHPNTPMISVNLSGITVMKENVVERILGIVDESKIPHSKLEIEITETAFVDKIDLAIHRIQELRTKGFHIAMDDFGVGISSLNRLKNMPIDTMKIDRAFIVDSIMDPKGAHIIRNIVNMAKDLNLETVAEGIETKEQEKFLVELGCDIGQGYYFSRPLPEKDFVKKLKN